MDKIMSDSDQNIVIFKIPHYYVSKKHLFWSKKRRLLIPIGGSILIMDVLASSVVFVVMIAQPSLSSS